MATTVVDVFGNNVTVEQVLSSNNMAMYSGYYNYAALVFVFLGIAVMLPGIVLALPFLGLWKGVEYIGGEVGTYAGDPVKTYAMFAVMYVAASIRNLFG